MDSSTISQLVFVVFGAAVFLYGFILYKNLSQLRAANDRSKATLNGLLRKLRDEEAKLAGLGADSSENRKPIAELQERLSADIQSFNESVRQYNSRIGQFPEAIVAAIMGLHRYDMFLALGEKRPVDDPISGSH